MPSNQPTWEDIQRSRAASAAATALEKDRAYMEEMTSPQGTRPPTWEDIQRSVQMYRGDMPRENYAPPFGQGVPYNSHRRRKEDILSGASGGFNSLRGGMGPTQIPTGTRADYHYPNVNNAPTLDPRGVLGPNYQERPPTRMHPGEGQAAQWERFRRLMER